MANTVLVTGGAGYIGSHTCLALLEAGYQVVVLDNLSTGRRRLVPGEAVFVEGDSGDIALVRELLKQHEISAVLHFAAATVVPESVEKPLKYYGNNTCNSRNLMQACLEEGVEHFVFSSTAAVYGDPDQLPVTEDASLRPLAPYGTSKLMTEQMLRDVSKVTNLRHVILRYFNVAGADLKGRTGQSTPEATHLIKVACEAACGKRDGLTVFGDDYATPDGTCVRDFIHVTDLAEAHVAALRYLEQGGESLVANCGYGRGFSVKEIAATVERVSGKPISVAVGPRREGDIEAIYADNRNIRETLNWTPKLDDIDVIVKSAYEWEQQCGF
ncbi:UDP-glucose 4-epimerase GalE [Aestuariispira ectoiniformans]|uniref:UDP-glucose 4-epimerase GalE n=1 Tax=Aestuariispira ectoiniformans TaxID=2775080 RepID=UPI00223ADADD|nr:UDP-glucose 4-epimerase GalE [Aestuariispira ectoiniformans]